ncbi:MAG: SCO family protein, partial [Burkholderiales bacterium PBB4]
MQRRFAIKAIAAPALSMGAMALLAACGEKGPAFASIDVTGADYAKDFELTDHNGQVRRLADFKGKVVVMFFGYTQCPDVCPTSMAELADVKKLLGKAGERL